MRSSRFFLFALILTLVMGSLKAQPFINNSYDLIDNDVALSLQVTPVDGGHITAGFTLDSFGKQFVNVVKYDIAGVVSWSFMYDFGTATARANAIELTPADGGYIIAGAAESPITGVVNAMLLKIDGGGVPMWAKFYDYSSGYSEARSVEVLPPGSPERYVWAGSTLGPFGGGLDMVTVVTDPAGIPIFTGLVATPFDDELYSVKPVLSPGGFITGYAIGGYTDDPALAGRNGYVALLDPTLGLNIWDAVVGSPDDEEIRSIEVTPMGEILAAGWSSGFTSGSHENMWATFFDPSGGKIWSSIYGRTRDERAHSVEFFSDGSFALAGWTNHGPAGDRNAALVRAGLGTGALIYARSFGTPDDDVAHSVKETVSTAGVIQPIFAGMAQATASSGGIDDRNIYVVKTDDGGDSACARKLPFGSLDVSPDCVPKSLDPWTFGYCGDLPLNEFPVIPLVEDLCCECSEMIIDFTPSATTACVGDVVTFTNASSCIDAFRWFVNGVMVAGAGVDLTYTIPAAGTYTFELRGRNAGCPIVSRTFTMVVSCKDGELSSMSAVNIMPNPVENQTLIDLSAEGLEGPAQIRIFDLSGKLVHQSTAAMEAGRMQSLLELAHLSSGLYQVEVEIDGQRFTNKLSKN